MYVKGPGSSGFVAPRSPVAFPRPIARPEPQPAASESVERPVGADDALWSVLTSEEREYFAQAKVIGPLTYEQRGTPAASPSMPRGQRINLLA